MTPTVQQQGAIEDSFYEDVERYVNTYSKELRDDLIRKFEARMKERFIPLSTVALFLKIVSHEPNA